MATIIKLYYNTGIRPEKNAAIEGITTFLSAKQSVTIPLNRFIQHDTSLSIKIDSNLLTDKYTGNVLNPFRNGKPDYCGIKNDQDGAYVYYYVMNKDWTATRTVTLELAIDSLTSFQNAWEFTDKTVVTREHKDRFINKQVTIGAFTYLPRKLYLDGDNIQPALYNKEEDYIEDYEAPGDWYLMYIANNTSGAVEGKDYPIDAYLVSGSNISVGSYTYRLTVSSLDASKVYYFGGSVIGSFAADDYAVLPDGSKLMLDGIYFLKKPQNGNWQLSKALGNGNSKYITSFADHLDFSSIKNLIIAPVDCLLSTLAQMPTSINNSKTGTKAPTKTASSGSVDGIETVDRTDTRILSILKLPYAPVDIIINEETEEFQLPAEIEKVSAITWQNQKSNSYLKIKSNYLSAFEKDIMFPKGFLDYAFMKKSEITDVRKLEAESALYRSDYFQFRFVYDSFSYPLQYELLDENYLKTVYNTQGPLTIKMVTTSTMNSRFLFDFNNNGKGYVYGYKDQDYPYIMNVARNNNVATYNSDYINYIRNGYNYDVKAKNAAVLNAGLGIATGALGTGIGLATGGIGTNIRMGINASKYARGAAIAADLSKRVLDTADTAYRSGFGEDAKQYLGTGASLADVSQAAFKESQRLSNQYNPTANVLALGQMVNGITGIINGVQQIQLTEANFQQKQHAIKQASVSVSGSDDIDLLSYYSKNKMKVERWECSDRMKKALGDLYYYQGYSTQEQKIPTHNNRKWFDFLQCQADIKNTKNLDQKFIDNIKDRLSIGVTYYHNVNGQWDLEQTKGNNEKWI